MSKRPIRRWQWWAALPIVLLIELPLVMVAGICYLLAAVFDMAATWINHGPPTKLSGATRRFALGEKNRTPQDPTNEQ